MATILTTPICPYPATRGNGVLKCLLAMFVLGFSKFGDGFAASSFSSLDVPVPGIFNPNTPSPNLVWALICARHA